MIQPKHSTYSHILYQYTTVVILYLQPLPPINDAYENLVYVASVSFHCNSASMASFRILLNGGNPCATMRKQPWMLISWDNCHVRMNSTDTINPCCWQICHLVTWMRNRGTRLLQGTSFSLVKRVSPDIADITASMPADRASRTQLSDWSARVFADCVVLWCWRGFTLHVHYVLQRNNKLTIAKRIQTSTCLDFSFPSVHTQNQASSAKISAASLLSQWASAPATICHTNL